MNDIQHQVIQSYEGHIGFNFSAPSLELDFSKVERFSTAYNEIRVLGRSLDAVSCQHVKAECFAHLRGVFADLKKQCDDEFETRFLDELQTECERILEEELSWYVKKPGTHFVELKEEKSLADAMKLHAERHYFGQLPSATVAELRDIASADLAVFQRNAVAGKLRREDLSVNSGATVRRIRDVLNREFKGLGVLDAVSAYTGRKTRVIGLALELSVPQATWWGNAIEGLERPPKTLYAHLDETISCPKSIVYLSNVTESNGPTGCYPGAYEAIGLNPLQEIVGRVVGIVGSKPDSPLRDYYAKQYHQSMNSKKFRQHFMRLPESIRFNSHLGWDVAPGSELEDSLVGNERLMMGPAGTFIIFDGARLLHRGGMVQQGERLALQVIFSDLTPVQRVLGKLKRVLS